MRSLAGDCAVVNPWHSHSKNLEAQHCVSPVASDRGFQGDCWRTPAFVVAGPGIHPRLKQPVGQRLALGALQAAYSQGHGAVGGVIRGCTLSASSLSLSFDMKGRTLAVRPYNSSRVDLSATAVLVSGSSSASSQWVPVHISLGGPGIVTLDLSSLPAGSGPPSAVRYGWGGVDATSGPPGSTPNGEDVTCCEGDGLDKPCVPAQCPLLATEPLAPFGALPVDPFIAKLVRGKCLCPEPQVCSE